MPDNMRSKANKTGFLLKESLIKYTLTYLLKCVGRDGAIGQASHMQLRGSLSRHALTCQEGQLGRQDKVMMECIGL